MKTFIAAAVFVIAVTAQDRSSEQLKHIYVPVASSAQPLVVAAMEIVRPVQYPSVIHLKGSVEIRMPVCVVTGPGNAQNCAGEIVFEADEADLHEDTGQIEAKGGARITRSSVYAQTDALPKTLFVKVDDNINLEVLDWGGAGRPLVLLAGLGGTAHAFDGFAPKLATAYHVYGITRRGFGASSAPVPSDTNYSADRLGDDVLAVIDFLKLRRPVLVGHSIAGEELSSVGTRHPEKVAGLIYLEAGYSYAYYDPARGDYRIDSLELREKLSELIPGRGPESQTEVIQELLTTILPRFERALHERQMDLQAIPAPPNAALPHLTPAQAIMEGERRYSDIRVPVLAIYAIPHDFGLAFRDPAVRAAAEARDLVSSGAQAKFFEGSVPSARVVILPHASHAVFQSNEADVLREMNAFLRSLPQ
jgi:non-heme chloroperoxidase